MSHYLGFDPTKEEKYYFVSYRGADYLRISKYAKALHDAGIPLWYDDAIEYDEAWEEKIIDQIRNCSEMILF